MVRTIIDVEGTPLRVQEARRMLTNWNKMVRTETISGVYRMRAKDIQEVMKDFTIKNGIIKHKTKAKGWSFNPKTLVAKTGKLKNTITKYEGKKIDTFKKSIAKEASQGGKTPKEEKSTPTPMKTEMPKKRRGRPKKIV
jgi:hypothetical protein